MRRAQEKMGDEAGIRVAKLYKMFYDDIEI